MKMQSGIASMLGALLRGSLLAPLAPSRRRAPAFFPAETSPFPFSVVFDDRQFCSTSTALSHEKINRVDEISKVKAQIQLSTVNLHIRPVSQTDRHTDNCLLFGDFPQFCPMGIEWKDAQASLLPGNSYHSVEKLLNKMTDFPFLAHLPSIPLEQIILKLNWKSYFRLQQTCHQMEEFIRTNGKLYTRLDKHADFKWTRDKTGEHQLILQCYTVAAAVTSLYGAQVKILAPPRYMEDRFSEFCKAIKKQRITCKVLKLIQYTDGFELTKEHCTELIKILKPIEIHMESQGSDRYEALVHSRNLKRLYLCDTSKRYEPDLVHKLGVNNVHSLMENLVRYQEVELFLVRQKALPNLDELVAALISIIQTLHSVSQLHWKLRKFGFHVSWESDNNFYEQLTEELDKYRSSLFKNSRYGTRDVIYWMDIPAASCTLTICRANGAIISYRLI